MLTKTERLLTVDEVANRTGLRPSTIRKLIFTRRLTVVKLGRAVRIPVEAVDAMIAKGWREPIVR